MRFIKTLLFVVIAVCVPVALQASDPEQEKRIKEFKEEFKGIYIVDGTDIYIQRVIEFPNTSKEELIQMVKDYVSRRLERLGKNVSNSNVKYYRDAYIMVEESPIFELHRWYATKERYTYRIEIKDNRIRATILLNEVVGSYNSKARTSEFYPFTKDNRHNHLKKHMKLFADYALGILDNIKGDMQDELLDDNW